MFLKMRMFQTEVVKNKNTHFMLEMFSENRVVCDIMWKNMI
jgi:hypothetical protein